ncbi:TetR/AcrR family transcriptional regulator [Aquimarina pacifica]|uniref:TetR/AcrR family transcriptional regulator n=1 Tax=Aquimarina pacifica TaxID=1296415 RepID=UPI00047280EF|nr:TetR/AcrR family transcriptional regulator [Aquimarina pacifica]
MPIVKTSKEEVLKKVIPILRIRGVQNSTMNELSKACGIQKSHFYYYFSNKEELIKEVLITVHNYFTHNFFKIVNSESLLVSQKMTRIKELFLKIFSTQNGGCIMANTALETIHLNPSYKKEIQLFFKDFILGIQLLLKEKKTPKESLLLAEQIVQDIEGGILLTLIYEDTKYVKNAIRRMETLITSH